MSLLILVTALAAQTAAPAGSTPPAQPTATGEGARTGSTSYLDLEAGAGYSSNPILSQGNSTGAGFGRISAHAVHTRVSARTTTVLSAYAQSLFYTKHYGSEQSVDVNARHDALVNEHLRVFGDLDASYDRGGQLDTTIIGIPNVPLPPGTTIPPILLPGGSDFLSVTGKQYRASGHLGAQLSLSPRDSMNVSGGVEHVVFKSGSIDTRYTTIPVSLGYERQISPRTTVGARVVVQHTDYNGPSSFRVISPEGTFRTSLSERLTFSGAAGVSFASVDDGVSTRHSTGFTGNANLCSIGVRGHLCLSGTVDQQAATVAGPARNISIGADYSRRLTADDTINFSLSANRYSSPTSVITGRTFSHATYVRAAGDYSRRLSDRWFGGVTLAARKVTQTGPDPDADVSGSLFIRYRLGDVR
jgi:hypothetical protein